MLDTGSSCTELKLNEEKHKHTCPQTHAYTHSNVHTCETHTHRDTVTDTCTYLQVGRTLDWEGGLTGKARRAFSAIPSPHEKTVYTEVIF